MLSLLYNKQSSIQNVPQNDVISNTPKVIDFGTLNNQKNQNNDATAATRPEEKNSRSFWSYLFNGKKKQQSDKIDTTSTPTLTDVVDKVISMKKIASSEINNLNGQTPINGTSAGKDDKLKDINQDVEGDDDDDFIDIQLRQLSYAEVAALNSVIKKNPISTKTFKKSKTSSDDADIPELIVVDQDQDLGKSVTDLEMVETFQNNQNNEIQNIDNFDDNDISADDQWEDKLLAKSKKSKQKLRNKRKHK